MVGFFFFFIAFLVGLVVVRKSYSYNVKDIALLSMVVKLALCVSALYIVLPFGGADGLKFERVAWEWSQGSIFDVLATIDVSRSYVISSIIALLYNILERDIAIPIFINGMMGMLVFYYAIVLAQVTWGSNSVNRLFALLVAMSPMLNVNSAVILRENYIALFAVLASIQLAKYARSGNQSLIFTFLFFVLLASFFHGGMILFALGLPLFIVLDGKNIGLFKRVVTGVFILLAFVLIMSFMEFGKLSEVQEEGVSVEYLTEIENRRQDASTAYLVGLTPSGLHDILWQGPVRSFYLLAKPFPWDVRNFGHFIVLLDAVLWWVILWLLWKNRALIKANPSAFALFLACAVTILAFAYGTNNFGTAVRHRTKFLVMALVLVSPFFPRIRLTRS